MSTIRHQILLEHLTNLRKNIAQQAIKRLAQYNRFFPDGVYSLSALNLAHYLELRQYDLRQTQDDLVALGLSSLGRGEAYIIENLDKVIRLLEAIVGHSNRPERAEDSDLDLTSGRQSLELHTENLLGLQSDKRKVRIMVTLPTEAATDYPLVYSLIKNGMNCARINCAHDNTRLWQAMIDNVRRAENECGKLCRIMMDIAGQKIRTGHVIPAPPLHHIKVKHNEAGEVVQAGKILLLPQTRFHSTLPAELRPMFRIGLDDVQHASLHAGDQLEFTDVRGKHRSLEILPGNEKGILIAECCKSAYISDNTVFKHSRQSISKKNYHQRKLAIKSFQSVPAKITVSPGNVILLGRSNHPGRPAVLNEKGEVIKPARICISHDEILELVKTGDPVWIDDGKIGTVVEDASHDGLLLKVTHTPPKGASILPDKGVNFPDTELNLPPLTEKDLEDLDFIVKHADIIAYSFVQSCDDISLLLSELKKRNATHLPIIAKIETKKAVKNLADIILSSIGRFQLGVMIARGDLAVELGSIRMAEMQEEILWLCEAAHVPVIWATQVLESLAKDGIQSRPEITDAAMSVRAECVMLNKGPYILEALSVLDNILRRMQEHQHKKSSLLRALKQWSPELTGNLSENTREIHQIAE